MKDPLKQSMSPKRLAVGLSGGVDSAVSAALLKEQGHDVTAFFMRNWHEDDPSGFCQADQDLSDAKTLCDQLGLPLEVLDLSATYHDEVFQSMLADIQRGITPNPDVLCNARIKFKAFLDHVLDAGFDGLATGHYAALQTAHNHHQTTLYQGQDPNKDQSYFLCRLTADQLKHSHFPLGSATKPQVRQWAEQRGLANARKKDSTGICFIGERRFDHFLETYLLKQPGPMVSLDGQTLGEHRGLWFYTPGQRKGLGIGGQAGRDEQPWYVVDKDMASNTLWVAQGNHPALYQRSLITQDFHWIIPPKQRAWFSPLSSLARIRHRQALQPCTVTWDHDHEISVTFDTPQRAITPGQYVALYMPWGECLGGGTISSKA